MVGKTLLKDQLFNAESVGQLAAEYAAALPDFDADRFVTEALSGFAERELMARMAWMADCLEGQLAADFPTMAAQLQAALPPRLDPSQTDDDFGRFIHALPGILAVRHGLEDHRPRAMALLYEATQRFSMEFYIRPFLNRWPEETLADLAVWARDDNYHVRRLVSEGTRPRLPWAQGIGLAPEQTLRRHALRSLIKQGHGGAMAALGYHADVPVTGRIILGQNCVAIGEALEFEVELMSEADIPVLVDYRIGFARTSGKTSEKVFKLKTAKMAADKPLRLVKRHVFKAAATTFTLYAGAHSITVQVNGRDVATAAFHLMD